MKITLLGNCQTKALTWYIQQINLNFDVKWICIEYFREIGEGWIKNKFNGKFVETISDTSAAIGRLKLSDYVIFQHLRTQTSENYNLKKIKMYAKNAKLISISRMFYQPDDPSQKLLKGMIKRAKKFNIDIPAHKIIEKHGSKITMQEINHPHVFYFLELVKEICVKTGWDYYTDEKYDQYLKEGYPFG
jgi:hypothetical protein